MIKPFQTQQPANHIALNHGARKVFDEAAGVGMVPEVEDRYEDMACDFLEQWLVSSEDPFTSPKVETAVPEPQPKAEVQLKAEVQPKTPSFEPAMSSFNLGLDWKLSDGRKLG